LFDMQKPGHHQSRAQGSLWPAVYILLSVVLLPGAAGCSGSPEAENSDTVSGASRSGESSPAIFEEIPPLENGRRILVVYFSSRNATKRVAEDIAAVLQADIERIVENKTRKWGFFGFMLAGAASSFRMASPIVPPARDPASYEAVVVCTPIWAWNMTPPMRSWLRLNKGKLPRLTAYVTVSGNTDPDKVASAMAKESGRTPIAVAGFVDRDFEDGNRPLYLGKIRSIVDRLR